VNPVTTNIKVSPVMHNIKVPAMTHNIKVPAVTHNIKVPTVSNIKVPTVSNIKVPTVSNVKVPTVSNIKVPTVPNIKVPTVSDIRLKRDVVELGQLPNGIHVYRYRYLWSDTQYVGVMAQEVLKTSPDAVIRGSDGYLRVDYERLGLHFGESGVDLEALASTRRLPGPVD
jgi:endosialidase-like protein